MDSWLLISKCILIIPECDALVMCQICMLKNIPQNSFSNVFLVEKTTGEKAAIFFKAVQTHLP